MYVDTCQDTAFFCAEQKCIRGSGDTWFDKNQVCDGVADCQGGEDEVNCGKWRLGT
jgi:hypothetical protein